MSKKPISERIKIMLVLLLMLGVFCGVMMLVALYAPWLILLVAFALPLWLLWESTDDFI